MLSNRIRDGGNAAKRVAKVTPAPNRDDKWVCRAYIIRMSGPKSQLNPTVRILLISANRCQAVYEGWGPASTFQDWISRYLTYGRRRYRKTALDGYIPEAQFSTVRKLRVSLRELQSYGFVRVDR